MAKRKQDRIEPSSGNVFADLNLPNPEEKQMRVRLSVAINRIIEDRGFTQSQAARVLGIRQRTWAALQGYQLDGFSVGRLMRLLTKLGYDVILDIQPRSESTAEESVTEQAA